MADFINTSDIIGDDALIDSIIERTITEYNDDKVSRIGDSAFSGCKHLEAVECPNATRVEFYAFGVCSKLASIDLPMVKELNNNALQNCTSLVSIKFQNATWFIGSVCRGCTSLVSADLPSLTTIGISSFRDCSVLSALILRGNKVCTLGNVDVFTGTPIASGTGYIYVPRALLSDTDATKDYRRATNWSTFAAQFRALEDFTVDGTVDGELDETKIAA